MYRSIIFALALLVFSTASLAGEAQVSDKIRQDITRNFRRLSPHLVVKSVRPLDAIPGLYEVQVGDTVFYSDATGKHMISGHIFETDTQHDITESRIEDINRIDWKRLPLKNAIVSGDPNGMPLAIFTDPDCPFCRELEKELRYVKGVKVYTFLFPLVTIHEHARADAEAIWCAKDKHKALLDIMLHGKDAIDIGAPPCKTPIDETLALGEELKVTGTPTLIAGDGRMHAGGFSAKRLKLWLENRL
jgi:thiol:disulfide interchange protein DsbC